MLCIIIPSTWLPNTMYGCTVYAFCLNWGVRDYGDDHSDHANQIQPDIYQLHGVLQRRHKRLLYDTNNDRLSLANPAIVPKGLPLQLPHSSLDFASWGVRCEEGKHSGVDIIHDTLVSIGSHTMV